MRLFDVGNEVDMFVKSLSSAQKTNSGPDGGREFAIKTRNSVRKIRRA
jgi:hypothetical protein